MRRSSFQHGFMLRLLLATALLIFLGAWAARAWVLPPEEFPKDVTITIDKGESLGEVAYELRQANVIKSAEAFKLMMLALGEENRLTVGRYRFNAPLTSIEVALKLSGKDFGILQNRVTFPEGFTAADMGKRLAATFEDFDEAAFVELAKREEGYLFPDTYSFDLHPSPMEVITVMKWNFTEKTAPLRDAMRMSKYSERDIVIMASIIEREAGSDETEARTVSGILWKRLEKGIPLQVDAPFAYLFGKSSAQLSAKDLATNSPYNTYKYKGLPPGPISNPGLTALNAALFPLESPYLYYLHDAQGGIHYASTHSEHVANKANYLP